MLMLSLNRKGNQRWIQDFQGGRQPHRGSQPIIWSNFAENCMKMENIDRGGVWRVQNYTRLCRSATGNDRIWPDIKIFVSYLESRF